MDSLSDKKQSSGSFFAEEEKPHSVRTEFNKLFGRQKPVHHILGGGKRNVHLIFYNICFYNESNRFVSKLIFFCRFQAADVLLLRNKKISASVLFGATAV
ncbi:hypothetical protein Hanom_Chr03g00273321 [Helianthus anomalus]